MSERTVDGSIVGVILAGGLARRMGGGDKGLLAVGRDSMLARVVAIVAPQTAALAINANGDAGRFAAFGLDVVADPLPGHPGPLAGVLAGLEWAARRHPAASHVLTVPSDAPFLPADLVARLRAGLGVSGAAVVMARSAGRAHPVAALWSVHLAGRLAADLAAGARKVERWAEAQGAAAVDFPLLDAAGESIDPFFNANTPEDLAEARRLLSVLAP